MFREKNYADVPKNCKFSEELVYMEAILVTSLNEN